MCVAVSVLPGLTSVFCLIIASKKIIMNLERCIIRARENFLAWVVLSKRTRQLFTLGILITVPRRQKKYGFQLVLNWSKNRILKEWR